MAKKIKEPQYIMSALNTPMINYKTYIMNARQKLVTFLIAFIIGGIIGLTFYGGQFRDETGATTGASTVCDIVIFAVAGITVGFIFCPIRSRQLQRKRVRELTKQFRSMLESLAVALSSGMNMQEAMVSAYGDLKIEYSEKADIVKEVKEMIDGIQNNIPIESMLVSLGERSQIEDIKSFGVIFETCYRVGGNMKDVVRRTSNIISEKIQINEEIETALTSNKTQFTAMMVVPIVIVNMLRMMSRTFAVAFATLPGIIAMTVAIGMFFAAYKLGQKIMNVKG